MGIQVEILKAHSFLPGFPGFSFVIDVSKAKVCLYKWSTVSG